MWKSYTPANEQIIILFSSAQSTIVNNRFHDLIISYLNDIKNNPFDCNRNYFLQLISYNLQLGLCWVSMNTIKTKRKTFLNMLCYGTFFEKSKLCDGMCANGMRAVSFRDILYEFFPGLKFDSQEIS